MTERPHNARPASAFERTNNSHRHLAEARGNEVPSPTRSYHGSHRVERARAADVARTAAYDRSSRVGHHHCDRRREYSSRW
jgi:hypothetical protein